MDENTGKRREAIVYSHRIRKNIRSDSGHEDSPKRPVSDSAQSYEDGNKDNKVN
jgi:hypothetical protein